MIKRLGYCCINSTLSENLPKKEQVLTSRTLRMASFSLNKVSDLILNNVKNLKKILQWNKDHKIFLFRISSEIFPFMDHLELGYELNGLKDYDQIISVLKDCGNFAKENGMRLTTHPGPYNCLGSPNEDTVNKTIKSLEMHSLLGKLLGLDKFNINIHVGGSYGGDFQNTADRFNSNFNKLSEQCQKWLTIENDDKASLWTVSKLKKYISELTSIPIVFDLHHWRFCNEETLLEAANIAFSTWKGEIPKIHVSESRTQLNSCSFNERPQAHSDYILEKIPDLAIIDYDVMFECKAKEKALLKYRQIHNINN